MRLLGVVEFSFIIRFSVSFQDVLADPKMSLYLAPQKFFHLCAFLVMEKYVIKLYLFHVRIGTSSFIDKKPIMSLQLVQGPYMRPLFYCVRLRQLHMHTLLCVCPPCFMILCILCTSYLVHSFHFSAISLEVLWQNFGPSEGALAKLTAKACGVPEAPSRNGEAEKPKEASSSNDDYEEWVVGIAKKSSSEGAYECLFSHPMGKLRYAWKVIICSVLY